MIVDCQNSLQTMRTALECIFLYIPILWQNIIVTFETRQWNKELFLQKIAPSGLEVLLPSIVSVSLHSYIGNWWKRIYTYIRAFSTKKFSKMVKCSRHFHSFCRHFRSFCWHFYSFCRHFYSFCRHFYSFCRHFYSFCRHFYSFCWHFDGRQFGCRHCNVVPLLPACYASHCCCREIGP
jgi:hypothetical protein